MHIYFVGLIKKYVLPFTVFLLVPFQGAAAAFDYNGSPLNKSGALTSGPTTSQALLNSYFQSLNNAGLPNNRFGSLGIVSTFVLPQSPLIAGASSLLLQPDGKVILAGLVDTNSIFFARYNSDGSLDSSFGTRGTINTGISSGTLSMKAALLNSGQIVTTASDLGGDSTLAIFSSTGIFVQYLTSPVIAGSTLNYIGVAVQPNGSILGIGQIISPGPTYAFFVSRWLSTFFLDAGGFGNPNGYVTGPVTGGAANNSLYVITVDTLGNTVRGVGTIYGAGFDGDTLDAGVSSYSSNGFVTTLFTTQVLRSSSNAMVIDGNGYIVTAGFYNPGGGANVYFPFISYTNSGATPFMSSPLISGQASALLLQPTDKKIIVVGNDYVTSLLKIARYNGTAGAAYGTLDTTFGNGGILSGIPMTASTAALQPDGKILVGGNFGTQFSVIRLNPDGTIDPTFQTFNFLGQSIYASAAALQSNGAIVVAGTNGPQNYFVSYTGAGSLNSSFGSGAFARLSGSATASVVQPDGNLVFASCCGQFCLARYTPAGILDTTFGGGKGFVTGPVGAFSPYALLLQPNGYFVALGTTLATTGNFCLVRYTTTGIVDTTFGGGLVTGHAGTSYAGALQANGQIIAAGNDGAGNIYVVRYNADGSQDTTFNGTGSITGRAGSLYAATLQSDGKLVAAGVSGGNFLLLRANVNGSLDTSFGTNGMVPGPEGTAYALGVQPDGKILAFGTSGGNSCVCRFNTNGSLDTTFGSLGTGIVTGGAGSFYAALLQANNQILGVGSREDTFFANNYTNPFTLASFNASCGPVGLV
jgi:uncharacterized delta-60 repeat protein